MTVIGPIDHATWYSMRQCRETINYLKPLAVKNPIYDLEIKETGNIYNHYMKEVLKAA